MITDSHYWKKDLLKRADHLERRAGQQRWSQASRTHLEQTVMLGFYAILKLLESRLLDEKLQHRKLSLLAYPPRMKHLDWSSSHHLPDLYDMHPGTEATHTLSFLCHQVVHSYLFEPRFDKGKRLDGLYLTSDHQRNTALYYTSIEQVIDLFREVGEA